MFPSATNKSVPYFTWTKLFTTIKNHEVKLIIPSLNLNYYHG